MTDTSTSERSSGRSFRLLELLGKGAFGEVYLAEQSSGSGFRRKVALKVLNADVAKKAEAGRRMRDEARILGRLAHRNIVAVLDLVELDDRWAVVMDHVPGADLEHVLEALARTSDPFPAPAALEAGAAVLRALHAAFQTVDDDGQQLGVIHRDIKPSNVRLTDDGDVKVLDFGVARFSLDTREAETRASGWIGTERYMSPERILCEGDSAAGDVYAAGATVVECLLGRPLGRTPVLEERHAPFVDNALKEVRERLDADDRAHVDAVIEALRSALSTMPEDRPAADHLASTFEALARAVKGEPLTVFARRFVPKIAETLGREVQTASGTLCERSNISAMRSQSRSSGTMWPEGHTPETTTASGRRLGGVWVLGSVAAFALVAVPLAMLGAIGGGIWYLSSSEEGAVAPLRTPRQVEPPTSRLNPVPVPGPEPTPNPKPAPKPVAAPTPPPPTPARPQSLNTASGPPVPKAQLSLPDASSITVQCGAVKASGTASVRITKFPSGNCRVRAQYLGKTYTSSVRIDKAAGYTCKVTKDALRCS